MIEQKIKYLLGEYAFQACILQEQIEKANEKIALLEAEPKVKKNEK